MTEYQTLTNGTSQSPSSLLPGSFPDTERQNKYETSLNVKLNILASSAYFLGPLSGLILLITETRNDYVRYNAWQSVLVGTTCLVLNLILSLMGRFLLYMMFLVEIVLFSFMGYKAYLNSDNLERYLMPYFGVLASEWVDQE